MAEADGCTICHIGDEPGAAAVRAVKDLVQSRFELIFVTAGDDDIGAGFGEAACHGLSEAFAAASDEGHPSGKIEQ